MAMRVAVCIGDAAGTMALRREGGAMGHGRERPGWRSLARWLTVLGVLTAGSVDAADRVELGAFEYPPIYQDTSGPDKGLAIDLALAAFQAANVEVDLRFYPVARMIHYLETGAVTCAIGGQVLYEDPAVAANVRVGSVILYVLQTFFYDRRRFSDGFADISPDRLRGVSIGALNSSGIMRTLQRMPGLKLIPNTSHEGSARQLAAGRIDLWAIVDLTGQHFLTTLFPEEVGAYARTAPFNRGDVSLTCSRTRDADGFYAGKFAEGLALIKKNGSFRRIMAKYYGGAQRIPSEALPADMR
ncbi:substrate-binding periplasmic protein [Propionivibrio dicarboxylicus]|uniref:ABC-type amino acid transport substrate-binding protein n=1 Tax=Propionivibrio dicarboxylicus TaxID=83767 RepID=A0A1G8E6T6_9RHOO|nr:transporter substrate-binding domain-containing protein [Propionivibrio dicarboxylicus]SDH65652.1 ABC-type amino acid transport substrate-binding protein [Propionivibrio dicarboxylicus]